MKLEMTVNFDFGKLADNLDNLLGNYAHRVSVSSADRAKEAIDSGKFLKLLGYLVLIIKKHRNPY